MRAGDASHPIERALVTGAGGFVGRSVVALLRRRGVDVVGLTRRPGSLGELGIEERVGDLEVPDTLRGLAHDCDAIFHLASIAHQEASEADYQRVIVEGTDALLREAASAGARIFVFVSSVKAAGEQSGRSPLTEADPPQPADAYGRAKLKAEGIVLDSGTVPHPVVVRPPMIYGPGNKGNLPRLAALVRRGWPIPLGAVENRRSMVHVENVAAAMLALAECGAARSQVFYVSDGSPISTPALIALLADSMGVRPRLAPVPPGVLELSARLADLFAKVVRVPWGTDVLTKLTGDLVVDSGKLRSLCGFEPPISLQEGIRGTFAHPRE